MSHIFLVGATGGVGSRLHPILTEAGHTVTALHRKPGQAEPLRRAGVTPVAGDIIDMEPADLARAMQGADTIVFSAGAAGSGQDRATAIDGDGPIKLLKAAAEVGAKRIYIVSVFPEAGRRKDLGDGFEHYMEQKKRADVAVASSDLDWVILRPGTLTDDDGNGQVNLGPVIPYGDVARGNVAKVLARLIDTPEIRREIIELTDGDRPVPNALADIASLRDR